MPPYLRALFRRIGVPIGLRIEIPEGTAGLPATMLALLKLSARGITLTPPEVVIVDAEAPPRVVLGHGDRSLALGPDELAAPGQPLATAPLPAGFAPGQQIAFRINLGPKNQCVVLDNVKITQGTAQKVATR